ncbi:hypothetical protein VL15_16385 [Burkholderia cepacia]|uniref:Uncharacterized protein n=1 Tax=Burkholderia cepacia TaxID=292 RepID=A0A0J5X038_BURCE|nr:hypothetical protein VL15_16385 [Burkholderia cepacia]
MRPAGAAARFVVPPPSDRPVPGARAPARPLARRDIPKRFVAFSCGDEKGVVIHCDITADVIRSLSETHSERHPMEKNDAKTESRAESRRGAHRR